MHFTYLLPVFGILAVAVAQLYFVRKHQNSGLVLPGQDPGAYRADLLAQRLRLQVVGGDAHFNYAAPNPLGLETPMVIMGKHSLVWESRLEGAPDGYPTQLSYYRSEERVPPGVLTPGSLTKRFSCRFAMRARRPFPAFEIIAKVPLQRIQRELSLPQYPSGNPALDSKFEFYAEHPAVLGAVAPLLSQFSSPEVVGLHLVGEGDTVAFVMQESRPPLVYASIFQVDVMQRMLTAMVQLLGG